MTGSLVVVGTGMRFVGHLTLEVQGHLEEADEVFLVVMNPATVQWIHDLRPNVHQLRLYREREEQKDSADEWERQVHESIADVLAPLRDGAHVCVVLDGHPAVLVRPVHQLVQRARAEGHVASILPGISAEDCLFADLEVDPAVHGCLSFEATDFLIRRRPLVPTSNLILRQIGLMGELALMGRYNKAGVEVLADVLTQAYSPDHEVIVYEAAQFPMAPPGVIRTSLDDLPNANITDCSTLFVPPIGTAPLDPAMLERLGLPPERVRR